MIRAAESRDDVLHWLAVRNEVFPAIAIPEAAFLEESRRAPAGRRLLLHGDDGFALVRPADAEEPDAWLTVGVRRPARRGGIGSALYAAGAAHLAALGVTRVRALSLDDGDPAPPAFLAARGFREAARETVLELALDALPPVLPAPAGVVIAEEPWADPARAEAYALEVETARDIPGEEATTLPPYDDWVRHLEAEGAPLLVGARRGGTLVAIAVVTFPPGAGHAIHWMTGVRRDERGAGIGRALKSATLAAARARGAATSRTFNEARNHAMRAINAGFGYRRLPDLVIWEGPCSA